MLVAETNMPEKQQRIASLVTRSLWTSSFERKILSQ